MEGPDDSAALHDKQAWDAFSRGIVQLQHPGIVRVRAALIRAGERQLVMDDEPGPTLQQWVAAHPDASVAERIALLRTVAAGLDAMHASPDGPLTHGAVSPANIVVRRDGSTVLVGLSASGARGTVADDSYAFVRTLAETLTGAALPTASDGSVDIGALAAQLQAAPTTRRRHQLIRRVLGALTATPEARPTQLRAWLDGGGEAQTEIGAASPGAWAVPLAASAAKPRRPRNRYLWVAGALVVIGAVAVTLTELLAGSSKPAPPPPATAGTLHITQTTWLLGCGAGYELAAPVGAGDITDPARYPASPQLGRVLSAHNGGAWYQGMLELTLRNDTSEEQLILGLKYHVIASQVQLDNVYSPVWIYRRAPGECEPAPRASRSFRFDLTHGRSVAVRNGREVPITTFAIPAHSSVTLEIVSTLCGDNDEWIAEVYSAGASEPLKSGPLYLYGRADHTTRYVSAGGTRRAEAPVVNGADPRCGP